jgi:alkylated DNA repair dioxygenase AlkB
MRKIAPSAKSTSFAALANNPDKPFVTTHGTNTARHRFLCGGSTFFVASNMNIAHNDEVRFRTIVLDPLHQVHIGHLPNEMLLSEAEFEILWNEHPPEYHLIHIHGRDVATPRWQQAYGHDYHYTGRTNAALPLLPLLKPILHWCQSHIDARLNGVLLNWYDADHGHYIGKHRDSTKNMAVGCPIVTISLGSTRTFRLRPWREAGYQNFSVTNGSIIVLPYETNQTYTHEVLRLSKDQGRRISVTLRGFV